MERRWSNTLGTSQRMTVESHKVMCKTRSQHKNKSVSMLTLAAVATKTSTFVDIILEASTICFQNENFAQLNTL